MRVYATIIPCFSYQWDNYKCPEWENLYTKTGVDPKKIFKTTMA